MSVKGDISTGGFALPAVTGSQNQDSQWAVGGRIGYLVLPQLMTYVSAGYTQAHWTSTSSASQLRRCTVRYPARRHQGWLVHRHRRRICFELPARLVLENRISLFGVRHGKRRRSPPCPAGTLTGTARCPRNSASTAFAASWSTASTGAVDREVPFNQAKKPRHRPGLFCALAKMRLSLGLSLALPLLCRHERATLRAVARRSRGKPTGNNPCASSASSLC